VHTIVPGAAAAAHVRMLELVDSFGGYVTNKSKQQDGIAYYGWIVLIGILVVAAAAAWGYCLARGYRGFTGNIEAVKGPLGIKIGVKLECY
jgi:hypothetical protein